MYHWRGYWEQFGMGRQPMEDLVLSLQDGAVRGRGRDIIGLFTFVGQMDAAGRLAMEKQYVGQHAVLYQGQYDGEGTIFGEWSIAPVDRGKFMLRLSRDASGHASSEAIEEITPRVSRR